MRSFVIRLSLFSIALVAVVPVFPLAAVLIPICAAALSVCLAGGLVFFVWGVLGRLAAPRGPRVP